MITKTAPFDAADYLDNEETNAEFLTAALEDPNPEVFLKALRDVAKARTMADMAKALAPGAKPSYETVRAVMLGLGITMQVRTESSLPPAPTAKVRS